MLIGYSGAAFDADTDADFEMTTRAEQIMAYWRECAADPDYEVPDALMMLAPGASGDVGAEAEATLALLPEGRLGEAGVELGCGVGRLTPHLSRKVDTLQAYELLPEFAAVAKERCSELGLTGVRVICGDATQAALASASLDLIVIKWLLMYLDDAEADALLRRAVRALRPGGWLLLHESVDPAADSRSDVCYRPWGPSDPQRYRHEAWYLARLDDGRTTSGVWTELSRHDLSDRYGAPYQPGDNQQIAFVGRKA